ncbi:probable phospholipid-transporting ATPase IIB [Galleria mellonella]|uniref:Phospholipid-transporting ATPase n=1 Tax=Galleria mellonella TaxID=7137 RepID=A0ABM3MQS6_GALME|nr:probable phospholipid-transporting ATPase IIB [Galleria mellonella]XP_052753717.1 probable phospholipid-transporting ATPase IIB [Galleria mellonella]
METTPLLARPKKSLWSRLKFSRFRKKDLSSRVIYVGQLPDEEFPPNYVCNQKYNIITFLPLVLFEQFRFFLNMYFLVMACSQFIPSIRIGYLYTYWGPLCFVLAVTLFREAVDDIRRYRRDREVNRQRYDRIVLDSAVDGYRPFVMEHVPASALRVGDIVILHKGQRVPADMILLRTNETMGTVFIRTDQLDGEIDWKLRIPLPSTQKLPTDAHLLDINAQIFIEKPEKDIHSFIGTCTRLDEEENDSLDIENTLWSGCVVASGQATGLVIYTGSETRSVMNNATPRSKIGRLDLQVNNLTKVLFVATIFTSFLLIVLKGFNGPWYGFLFRFILLFSYIIPISLRVNLEMGKAFYSWTIQRDKKIEGTVMRSTTIPEELGRIQYLLADKTGTLTKNEMVFQKLHLGNALFDRNHFHEVESLLTQYVTKDSSFLPMSPSSPQGSEFPDGPTSPEGPSFPDGSQTPSGPASPRQVWQAVLAIALCHNVTPVYDIGDQQADEATSDMGSSVMSESCGGAVPQQQLCDYQAASPDEVALVKWTDMMGISLYRRDLHNISLKLRAANEIMQFTILQIFPFTSESKMMGIIVQEENTEQITYYVKGADVALAPLVRGGRWLPRECGRLAADGLRTLVLAYKTLTKNEYLEFESEYKEARLSVTNRSERTAAAIARLQRGLLLLGLTGVEDRLADDVTPTLAMLRTAGIKIWMLTGDKLETAECIARSLQLGGGDGVWVPAARCAARRDALRLLQMLSARDPDQTNLIIEGETLEVCLRSYEKEFVEVLERCSGVVVARCSPTQKAAVARLLRARNHVVAAVGDGGNDVAMIQEADMGVGIEGAEGRAASLAGDVSVRQFQCLARLLLVHGRRAATRSAALCLFIVHRGLIVSTMQAVFSVVFYFSSVSLYPGFLMVGYGTIYTMLPVFSLVLDKDISSLTALRYPQLYKQLTKGRQLSYKTFYIWTGISIYQGGVIMYGALVLFEDQLIHIVEISYTALILTELIMVALTIVTWHRLMAAAELLSLLMYTATLLIFTSYFDADFIRHWDFWWKVTVITLVSCLPLYIVKYMHRKWSARQYKNIRH